MTEQHKVKLKNLSQHHAQKPHRQKKQNNNN